MPLPPPRSARDPGAARAPRPASPRALAALAAALPVALSVALSSAALAGDFSDEGVFSPDPGAYAYESFHAPRRVVLATAAPECEAPMFEIVEATPEAPALEGKRFARLDVQRHCGERFAVSLPKQKGSYVARLWTRHGSLEAQMVVLYPGSSGLTTEIARLFPTGRATSDGWVELASNEFPVDGEKARSVYLRTLTRAHEGGIDVDALEIVPKGSFEPQRTCSGLADPVCGSEHLCLYERCVPGRAYVPELPEGELRESVVRALASRFELFYGGRFSRLAYLPDAMAELEAMGSAQTAWQFWSGFAHAVRRLHDWHTYARSGISSAAPARRRLNACFIEGDADLSHDAWPKDPLYPDLLVSHAGKGALGLLPGDRLVAVDGVHPLAWARSLSFEDWGYQTATDPAVYADFAERLGGPSWAGGSLLLRHAREITILRCSAEPSACDVAPETIRIADVPNEPGGPDVACDNRPGYHLEGTSPDPSTHHVFYDFFRGRVSGTLEEEKIFGMVWDTLYGGGDPNGFVNSNILGAVADFKENARGVILDHRAGSGGTLDAAEYVTTLVRPRQTAAVVRMPIQVAGVGGPATPEEGKAIFDASPDFDHFIVGAPDHDPTLPVALILHRDGSASDYMPFGMKGAPKVRIFGPARTAGAFSTFIEYAYWGGIGFQLASGDTIAADGTTLIGAGVEPDEVLLPRQSDLVAGKDTLHEAALAWVRKELKP